MENKLNPEEISVERAAKTQASAKKKWGIAAGIIATCILVLCGSIYAIGMNRETFLSNSTINGVDVAGMTAEEAQNALAKEWNAKTISITENGEEIGTLSLADTEFNLADSLEESLHPSFIDAAKKLFKSSERQETIDMSVENAGEAFDQGFQALSIVENGGGTVKTSNAYVDMSSNEFNVVEEVYGDNLDEDLLKTTILDSVSSREDTFDYVADAYYAKPSITKDSQEIQDQLDYCNKYLSAEITYKTPYTTFTLTPEQLDTMLSVTEDGQVQVDEDAVKEYVENTLARKVSTVGITRTRTSAGGGTYTVSGGSYGLTLNKEEEIQQLTEDLKTLEDVTRYPCYNQSASSDGNYYDIGSTYVEVDISAQHCWFVKNGSLVIDRDVVTGNVARGNATPHGVYYVYYKTTNATLTDNETYWTDVSYWMPFNGGIGMHDATYISVFGGSRYLTNGSHGCINMPLELARTIYQGAYAGMPVIVHG